MFLIRTVFFLGLVVVLMPTDEKQQTRLMSQAAAGLQWTATFCDRNASTCKTGTEMWATFVKKAEFGFTLAMGMARDWAEQPSGGTKAGDVKAGALRPEGAADERGSGKVIAPASHLRRDDKLPPWRGPAPQPRV